MMTETQWAEMSIMLHTTMGDMREILRCQQIFMDKGHEPWDVEDVRVALWALAPLREFLAGWPSPQRRHWREYLRRRVRLCQIKSAKS